MEEYQVITRGRLASGYSAAQVKQNLREHLGLEASVAEKLLSGVVVKIKSRLAWSKALACRRMLMRLGLQTELVVQFNPACFKAGLGRVAEVHCPTVTTGTTLIPDAKIIAPMLVNVAHAVGISTEQNVVAARLATFSAYWNPVVLLVSCAFIGLVLESYLLRVLTIHLHLGFLGSFAAIAFLLLAVVCLPRFLQPRQLHSISTADVHCRIHLLEKSRFIVGSTSYLVYNDEGRYLASMHHSSSHAEMLCPEGRLLFHWRQGVRVSDEGQGVADQMGGYLVENTAFGIVSTYLGYLRGLMGFFARKYQRRAVRTGKAQRDLDSARPVLDSNQRPIAFVYQHPEPAIKVLKNEMQTTDHLLLLGFCCQLIRNPLA